MLFKNYMTTLTGPSLCIWLQVEFNENLYRGIQSVRNDLGEKSNQRLFKT